MPGIGGCATPAIGRLIVVITEPNPRYYLRNVTNKPEVASLIGSASLPGNRSPQLSRTTRTISDDASQHPGHDCRTFFVNCPFTLKVLFVNDLTAPIANATNAMGFGMNSFSS
jgi:hypothetical protein